MADPVTGTLAGIGVLGTVLGVYGKVSEAQKEADYARTQAQNRELQAQEVERREAVRTGIMQRQGQELMGQQIADYGASGVEMQGSPLMMLEHTQANINQDITEMQRDQQFRASQLRTEAGINMDQANDHATAGWINAGSTVLTGVSKLGSGINWGSGGSAPPTPDFSTYNGFN